MIDAVYNPIGALTAYETGLASASAAVGAKKAIEAGWRNYRARKAGRQKRRSEITKAKKLLAEFDKSGYPGITQRLNDTIESFERGDLAFDDFSAAIAEATKTRRAKDLLALLSEDVRCRDLTQQLKQSLEFLDRDAVTAEYLQRTADEVLEAYRQRSKNQNGA